MSHECRMGMKKNKHFIPLAMFCLMGCESAAQRDYWLAVAAGDRSAISIDACQIACAPYSWQFQIQTSFSHEYGCTCSGPGAADGGVSK